MDSRRAPRWKLYVVDQRPRSALMTFTMAHAARQIAANPRKPGSRNQRIGTSFPMCLPPRAALHRQIVGPPARGLSIPPEEGFRKPALFLDRQQGKRRAGL